MNKLLTLGLLVLIGISACNKPDDTPQEPELPPLTQEGKNVLGCRVNGAVHVYEGKHTFGDPNGVLYSPYSTHIQVLADDDKYGDELDMILEGTDTIVAGVTYRFSTETSPHYARYYSSAANPYFITKNGSGWVRFARVDRDVAAGTFEFTAYFNNDSVKITEGRFDISKL